jgi:four helix bundle protein
MCYRATRKFPKDELYGLTNQSRRAAASVPANIAEGHGRDTRGEFIQFLRIAQGSLKELETHFLLAQRVDLSSEQVTAPLLARCEEPDRMLRALIRSLQAARE